MKFIYNLDMIKPAILISATLSIFLACGQTPSDPKSQEINANNSQGSTQAPKNMNDYYPFTLSEHDGLYVVMAEIEGPELYPKYAEFFEEREYSGSGYCWEGHIKLILEKLDPALLQHIDFDPEAGAFFSYADTKENQIKMVELLSPIFSDLEKLAEYVESADRSRIDD